MIQTNKHHKYNKSYFSINALTQSTYKTIFNSTYWVICVQEDEGNV